MVALYLKNYNVNTYTEYFLNCDLYQATGHFRFFKTQFSLFNLAKKILPKNTEAFTGVAVLVWTFANHAGTTPDLPITQIYRAWPSIATNNDVSIPKLAPTPITLDTQLNLFDFFVNAHVNGDSGFI